MWYWKIYKENNDKTLTLLKTYIESKDDALAFARSYKFYFGYKTIVKRFSEK